MSFRVRKTISTKPMNKIMNENINRISNNDDITESKNYTDFLKHSLINLQTNNNIMFSETDGEYVFPEGTKQLFISMVAGGGAGGYGEAKSGLFYSGGGGGAGSGHVKIPFNIENNTIIKIVYKIGRGGNYNNPDGTDTILDIYANNEIYKNIVVRGGKSGGNGVNNLGGKNGDDDNIYTILYDFYNKSSGEKGSITSFNIHSGGNGGSSLFYIGGRGITHTLQNTIQRNGKWGSGGGGLIPGMLPAQISNGGDGFIFVEYK